MANPKPTNPFANRTPPAPRSGGTSQRQNPPAQNRPVPPPTPPRLGNSPFNPSTRVDFEIVPVTRVLVRFDLNGMGDPFHRLLGYPLNVDYGDMRALVKAMEKGGEEVDALKTHLESAWQSYNLTGAVLFYYWLDEVKEAINMRALADKVKAKNNAQNSNSNGTNTDDELDDTTPPPEDNSREAASCLRAIDLSLTLNVLGRTRTNILLGGATLAFDRRLLERSLVTDDPRFIALVRATGYVEENLAK